MKNLTLIILLLFTATWLAGQAPSDYVRQGNRETRATYLAVSEPNNQLKVLPLEKLFTKVLKVTYFLLPDGGLLKVVVRTELGRDIRIFL